MSATPPNGAASHAPLKPVHALLVLFGIIVLLAGYLTISHLLGIVPTYAGILLLFYWFAVKGGAPGELAAAFVGALGGIGNAALLVVPGVDPGLSALLGLLALIVALYCLLAGFVPLLFNQAYMLLVTVAAIPLILTEGRFVGMAASVILSAVYFGGLVWLLRLIGARRSAREVGLAVAATQPPPDVDC